VIDLSDWTKEFQQENQGGKRQTKTPVKGDTEKADPLSTLADPTVEPVEKAPEHKQQQEAPVGTVEQPAGFPVLIIVKGPGAGKKLPLVPVTMTVGREHDNNIELKDEEVARYHARISYQSGHYVLEDLESSAGTWVNGEKVSEVALKHGDKIKVGATEMMIDFD
jgi:pSer/pThr/pTyr-binding forkhead associated (FHA) protein